MEPTRIRSVLSEHYVDAEGCLRILHLHMAPAVAALPGLQGVKLLYDLDVAVVAALVCKLERSERRSLLCKAVAGVFLQAQALFQQASGIPGQGDAAMEALKTIWPPLPSWFPTNAMEQAHAEAAGKNRLLPKLIAFNSDHKPLEEQETREISNERSLVTIPWREWQKAPGVALKLRNAQAKSAAFAAMLSLNAMCEHSASVQMLQDSRGLGKVSVVTAEPIALGELRVPAVVTSLSNLADKSHNFQAVTVNFHVLGAEAEEQWSCAFKCSPEFSLPQKTDNGFEWGGRESPLLFWAIKRSHEADVWNCELHDVQCGEVQATSFNSEKFADKSLKKIISRTTIPVIVNSRALRKGEEIVLKWEQAPEPKKNAKKETWRDDLEKPGKKNKLE